METTVVVASVLKVISQPLNTVTIRFIIAI